MLFCFLSFIDISLPPIAWAYAGFGLLVIGFLALDLGIFHRHAHVVSVKEAAIWTFVWVSLSLLFSIAVYFIYENHWLGSGLRVPVLGSPGETTTLSGKAAAQQYIAGYVIELSLSVDNLFVIAIILSYFSIPAKYQHRVLFWGILGALVMRGAMIAVGAVLIQRLSWITYIFGGFLVLTAVKMALSKHGGPNPENSFLVRTFRRFYPVAAKCDEQKFFSTIPGPDGGLLRAATPLLLALIVVEFTDLVFAVDSIPAIFAITADPFLVITSNVFAILGLRSMYFLLADMLGRFRFLKPALVLILSFVGIKMLLVHSPYKISTPISLGVVVALLVLAVVLSVLFPAKTHAFDPQDHATK